MSDDAAAVAVEELGEPHEHEPEGAQPVELMMAEAAVVAWSRRVSVRCVRPVAEALSRLEASRSNDSFVRSHVALVIWERAQRPPRPGAASREAVQWMDRVGLRGRSPKIDTRFVFLLGGSTVGNATYVPVAHRHLQP